MSLKVSPSKSWGKNVISQNTLSGSSQWKYAWICSGLLPPFQTVDSEPDACRRLPCNSAFAISSPSPVIASTKVQDDARTLRTSMAPDVEMHSAKLISLHEPSQSRRVVSTRRRVSSSMFIRIVVWAGRSAFGRSRPRYSANPRSTLLGSCRLKRLFPAQQRAELVPSFLHVTQAQPFPEAFDGFWLVAHGGI